MNISVSVGVTKSSLVGDIVESVSSAINDLTNNPTFGQTAQIGVELTGSISGLQGGETVVHRWRDGSDLISGANAATYTPVVGDDLETLRYAPTVDAQEVLSPAYTVRRAPPSFTTQPSFSANPKVGETITFSEGVAGPGAALSIVVLTLDGEDKSDELAGLDWDTSGETVGQIAFRVSATSSGGTILSNLITGNLLAAAAETDLVGTIETTAPNETFTLELRDLGSGSITCDMGDGSGEFTVTDPDDTQFTATYPTAGTHTYRLSGDIHSVRMDLSTEANRAKLRTVTNAGQIGRNDAQGSWFKTGLTSFTFGNTDIGNVSNFFGYLADNDDLVTIDFTGVDFSAGNPQNFSQMLTNATSLTSIPGHREAFGTAAPSQMDEFIWDAPQAVYDTLDLSLMSIANLSNGGLIGQNGMFDVINNNRSINQANFTAMIRAWSQEATDLDLQRDGVPIGFGVTPIASTGQPDTDLRNLETRGFDITCGRNAAPEVAAAPTEIAVGTTTATIKLPPDPFGNGRSVRTNATNGNGNSAKARTLEIMVSGGNWVEVADDLDAEEEVDLTSLVDGSGYQARVGFRNFDNNAGPSIFSAVLSFETDEIVGGTDSVTVINNANNPDITVNGDGNVSLAFTEGPYAANSPYNRDVRDNSLVTLANIANGPVPFAKPDASYTGLDQVNSENTGLPALWAAPSGTGNNSTFLWKANGVSTGDVDLAHTPTQTLSGPGLVLEETLAGVTIASDPVQIVSAPNSPEAAVLANWTLDTGPTSTPNSLRIGVVSEVEDNGFALTYLQYDVDGDNVWRDAGTYSGVGDYDIELDLPLVSRDIRIRFGNANGTGDPSDVKTDTTGAGVPAPVTNISTATGTGSKTVIITVNEASGANGSPLDEYVYDLDGDAVWRSLGFGAVPFSVEVTVPEGSTDYDITVAARNPVGQGGASGPETTTSSAAAVFVDPQTSDPNLFVWVDPSDAASYSGTSPYPTGIDARNGATWDFTFGNDVRYEPGVVQKDGRDVLWLQRLAAVSSAYEFNRTYPAGDVAIIFKAEVVAHQFGASALFSYGGADFITIEAGASAPNFVGSLKINSSSTALSGGPYQNTGMRVWAIEVLFSTNTVNLYVDGVLRATVTGALNGTSLVTGNSTTLGSNSNRNLWTESYFGDFVITPNLALISDYEAWMQGR